MRQWRHTTSALILLSIIFLPYWIYLPLLTLAIIYFQLYWEGILLGLLVDVLYGSLALDIIYLSIGFWALVLLIILLPMRKLLRTYA